MTEMTTPNAVTREKLLHQIIEYGNAAFDAGEWDDDAEEALSYEAVNQICEDRLKALEAAITQVCKERDELRALILENMLECDEHVAFCRYCKCGSSDGPRHNKGCVITRLCTEI